MTDTLYKFVDIDGYTHHRGQRFQYPIPTLNDDGSYTPGEWVEPQDGVLEEYQDTEDRGTNRLHLMKSITAMYAPKSWVCYIAEGDVLVGESNGKTAYQRVRLLEPVDIPLLAREGNLRGANLRRANLWGANLRGANLRRANLWGANLRRANLQGADLMWANLRRANLWGANLREANLREANLQEADLRIASLQGASLQGASLQGANLQGANLRRTSLTKRQRRYAISQGATLYETRRSKLVYFSSRPN